MGSSEENRLLIQGFNANEKVIRAAVLGTPSHCHPELVSGSGFDPIEGRLFPAFSGFLFFSAERFLEHDAETSSA